MAAKAAARKEIDRDALPGLRKTAILMLALKPDTASKVLKKLPRDRVEELSREIANTSNISTEVLRRVISEFYHTLLARQYADAGGLPAARALLEKTLSAEDARKIITSLEHSVYEQPFNFLQKASTDNLHMFLSGEHPQTIALVLSHLPASMASEVLVSLSADQQIEVITRIAAMEQTSPEMIKEVERGLEKRLAGMMNDRFERTGGIKAVAEMLNLAGRAAEKQIMESLSANHPQMVEDIRRLMFVFEDIIKVDDRGIQAVLKEVQNDELSLALKTASEDLRKKILGNMSERAAQLILEEMEFMGPVRVADVEAAQQRIVDIVRRLEDAGEIVIAGEGGGDLIV